MFERLKQKEKPYVEKPRKFGADYIGRHPSFPKKKSIDVYVVKALNTKNMF